MIVPQENEPALDNKLRAEAAKAPSDPSDPPPYYSQVDSENSTPFASTSHPLPDIKSCNFVSLSRQNESVSGSWIIDPSMMVPPALMPPLLSNETEEMRKNILLSSHNGSVDAQIYVLASQVEPQRRNKVLIETSSKNGSVSTKVHAVASTDPTKTRLPMSISTSSANGRIRVYLPRSFRGPMIITRMNGSIRLTSALQASVTPFSDVNHVQRSFIGHFDPTEWENDAKWTGDELTIDARNGNVNIYFIDESDQPAPSKPKAPRFFGRFFH